MTRLQGWVGPRAGHLGPSASFGPLRNPSGAAMVLSLAPPLTAAGEDRRQAGP